MDDKQLNMLFMKIDADSNGSVGKSRQIVNHTLEWHEFMNYMLLENQTLSSMKKQVSGYVKPENNADPVPSETKRCHKRNITCIQIIYPEDLKDEERKTRKSPNVSHFL